MILGDKTVVGYKEMQLHNDFNQSIIPDDCCWGISHVPPPTRSQSAIIVDDFKHFLVLAGSQSTHHIVCLPHGIYFSMRL